MMGNSLRRDWTAREEFIEIVRNRAKERRCTFRILVLEPSEDSPITQQRMIEEKDEEKRMIANSLFTLNILNRIREGLDSTAKKRIQMKVVQGSSLHCYMVRADDRMLVANYLSHIRGSNLPAMEIHGRDTSLFRVFAAEFKRMWELGVEWPRPTPTGQTRAEG